MFSIINSTRGKCCNAIYNVLQTGEELVSTTVLLTMSQGVMEAIRDAQYGDSTQFSLGFRGAIAHGTALELVVSLGRERAVGVLQDNASSVFHTTPGHNHSLFCRRMPTKVITMSQYLIYLYLARTRVH